MNILTCDFEDWYHILDTRSNDTVHLWGSQRTQIERVTNELLDFLDEIEVKITFFVVADFSKLYPNLVRAVSDRGHEISSHSKSHRNHLLLVEQALITEIYESKYILEDLIGTTVSGYRAPGFTIPTNSYELFYHTLAQAGYTYDSSWFNGRRLKGGNVEYISNEPFFYENIKVFPVNGPWPLGGGYLRFTPKILVRILSPTDYRMVYFHPREFYGSEFLNENGSKFKDRYRLGNSYNKLEKLKLKSGLLDMRLKTL